MSAIATATGAGNRDDGPFSWLVCDDERHIVRLVQVNLERWGHTIECAFDGQQAIDKMQSRIDNGERMFDKIFLDVMMPFVDGLGVLKWIRNHPETENMWVVMKIPKGQDQPPFDELPYRADVCLVAPFNPMDLLNLR